MAHVPEPRLWVSGLPVEFGCLGRGRLNAFRGRAPWKLGAAVFVAAAVLGVKSLAPGPRFDSASRPAKTAPSNRSGLNLRMVQKLGP